MNLSKFILNYLVLILIKIIKKNNIYKCALTLQLIWHSRLCVATQRRVSVPCGTRVVRD